MPKVCVNKYLWMLLYILLGHSFVWGFGQNKVQYHRFIWSYVQTEHFDIYYPQGGDSLAQYTAWRIESMYDNVSKKLQHELTARVPVILHSSHAEFEQTNVIRLPLHEAIGGFTEIFKNRVVLPFEGDYKQFYEVLEHELVHAFFNNMIHGEGIQRGGLARDPHWHWVNEGMAEWASQEWDLDSEFFLLDATTSGYIHSPVYPFSGFLAYKGGQNFLYFVEESYGSGTVQKWVHKAHEGMSLSKAFEKVTQTTLEEAGEIWLRELRSIYWPELGKREYGKSIARKLTHHGKDLSFFNLQPAISPDGKEIAFFSDRHSREGIFILNLQTEKVVRSVVQGGVVGKHESFHSFKSGLSWGPDSKQLAVVSKQGGKDVIHLIHAKTGRVEEEIAPDLQSILYPNWSRDGNYIVFSGTKGGQQDIYVWSRKHKALQQLTNDLAYDGHPVFSPSGKWVYFESDRGKENSGDLDIYRISAEAAHLDSNTHPTAHAIALQIVEKVISSPYADKTPTFGKSDSMFVYTSNRSGINNLYLATLVLPATKEQGQWKENPLSNLMAGCFTPSWSQDGKHIAFTLFERGGWDIFLMKDPLKHVRTDPLPKTHFIRTQEDSTLSFFSPLPIENMSSYDTVSSISSDTSDLPVQDSISVPKKTKSPFLSDSAVYVTPDGYYKTKAYSPKFSLDYASAGVGLSNFEGAVGSGQIALTDLMGDQEIQIGLFLNGDIKNSQASLLYHYLPYKWDYIIGAFYRAYDNRFTFGGKGRTFGATGGIVMPQSVFARWQMELLVQHVSRTATKDSIVVDFEESTSLPGVFSPREYPELKRHFYEEQKAQGIFAPTLSWSFDNTQWGLTGPVNGERLLSRFSLVPPVFEDKTFFWMLDVDIRKYFRFRKAFTLALKVNFGASEAIQGYQNPHQFLIGGDNFFNLFPFGRDLDNLPEETDIEGLFYTDIGVPLRGFRFFEFSGNRKVLTNLEFRFPFIREFSFYWPLPLSVRNVMGVVFADYGAAWTLGREWKNSQGMGIGYGTRLNLGIFVLRWSRAWVIDEVGNQKKNSIDYWSLGAEF